MQLLHVCVLEVEPQKNHDMQFVAKTKNKHHICHTGIYIFIFIYIMVKYNMKTNNKNTMTVMFTYFKILYLFCKLYNILFPYLLVC